MRGDKVGGGDGGEHNAHLHNNSSDIALQIELNYVISRVIIAPGEGCQRPHNAGLFNEICMKLS